MDELLNTENLAAVLQEYAVAVRNLYQDRLILHDRIATGDLLNSCEVHVEYNGTEYEVKMDLAEYWRYVEMDTRPHWPPPSAILRWVEIKPVLPHPDANGRIPSPRSLAYLIGRKISREGTTGSHDFQTAQETTIERFRVRIRVAMVRDVQNYIRQVLAR